MELLLLPVCDPLHGSTRRVPSDHRALRHSCPQEVHPLHDVPEGGSDDGSDAGGDTGRSGGPGPEELLARARLEQRRLLKDNAALQRRARGVLDGRAKGRAAVAKDLAYLEGAEARYRWGRVCWHAPRT